LSTKTILKDEIKKKKLVVRLEKINKGLKKKNILFLNKRLTFHPTFNFGPLIFNFHKIFINSHIETLFTKLRTNSKQGFVLD
jgi:hypothetical protein